MNTLYDVVLNFFRNTFFIQGRFDALSNCKWEIGGSTIALGDWLSHTATIITLVALALVAFRFVWWLVRLVGRGFTLRG